MPTWNHCRTDKRGNRRGFPPDVLAELGALQRYRDTL